MDVLHDNTEDSQYEMDVDGQTVFARYRKSREALTILWVEAPEQLRGTGAAAFAPEAAGVAALSRALREKFDPKGILNAGIMG